MKYYYSIIITISIVIFLIVLCRKESILSFVEGLSSAERPFLNVYAVDSKGGETLTNILFITHPFVSESQYETYTKKKAEGSKFLGMTSYSEFPNHISNPHDRFANVNDIAWNYNYNDLVDGWCYCFRNSQGLKNPKLLLSESDFANINLHVPDDTPKEYDFMYVCIKDNNSCEDGWQSYNRNWEVAKEMLKIMCDDFGLKGLLIGRINCEIPAGCHSLMNLTDFQEYVKFIKNYNKCKFLFVPNITDASPRVVTEAMCYNLPIFMNVDILGGWKYIIPGETGEFFNNNIDNFRYCLENFLSHLGEYKSRDHFKNNYGQNSGKQLLDFVKKIYKPSDININLEKILYLKPAV